MKKLLLLILMIAFSLPIYSQNKTSYQGELNVGYGAGIGSWKVDRFHVETIHGLRVNPYFFTGIGLGLSSYDGGKASIPAFVNFKGYFTQGNIQPYAFANLGYGFGDIEGFYGAGGIGLDFKISTKVGVYANLGYQSQGISDNVLSNGLYGPSNTGAFLVQVGIRF